VKKRILETIFFDQPNLYRIKRFVIEVLIWQVMLVRILGLKSNRMPDITSKFSGRRVLVAACGPGDVTTGPPIDGASQVTAFDLSLRFAAKCAQNNENWNVYCGDLCNIPHRDNEFDISVIYSSLHHIPVNAEKILGEIARVTGDQIIIVEGLLPSRGLLRWMLLVWWRIVDGGYHYYTLDELKGIINRLPLRMESSELFSPLRHMWLGVLDCRPSGSGTGKYR
jgi:SAM-dependent methyltransferase